MDLSKHETHFLEAKLIEAKELLILLDSAYTKWWMVFWIGHQIACIEKAISLIQSELTKRKTKTPCPQ